MTFFLFHNYRYIVSTSTQHSPLGRDEYMRAICKQTKRNLCSVDIGATQRGKNGNRIEIKREEKEQSGEKVIKKERFYHDSIHGVNRSTQTCLRFLLPNTSTIFLHAHQIKSVKHSLSLFYIYFSVFFAVVLFFGWCSLRLHRIIYCLFISRMYFRIFF